MHECEGFYRIVSCPRNYDGPNANVFSSRTILRSVDSAENLNTQLAWLSPDDALYLGSKSQSMIQLFRKEYAVDLALNNRHKMTPIFILEKQQKLVNITFSDVGGQPH
ncbi:hypothetical protein ACTXT7_012110 [Hymenolepis weldensis]